MIGYGNSYFISTILDSGGGVSGIPVNTVAPVISGGTSLGSVLSSTTGTWTGDPTITYAYQWKRNGNNIGGATNSTYTITIFDTGANITCTITATNGVGSTQATSNTINVQAFSAPVNTVAPVISGTSVVGYTLSSTDGTWTGNPTPTYTYQWYRGVNAIGGATSNTYTLVNADEGQSITCQVTGTNGIGSSTATSNALTVSSLVLDLYPSSAVAYSLRKLRTAYSGSAIRVRRSSDNAEQDIAFVGNDLDTSSLLTFCGANNGFVTTWYDQSTNANNSTQATAANQAQIVASGALILDVDTSKITTTWTSDRYALTNGISTNTKYFSISMFRRGATTTDNLIHLSNSSSTSPSSLTWLGTGTSYSVRSAMPTLLSFQNVSTQGRCIMTSLRDSANLKVGYRNGVQLTTTATEAPTSQTLNTFGQAGASITTSGQYQEYIYWDSDQSADRTSIENNIKTYWNAY